VRDHENVWLWDLGLKRHRSCDAHRPPGARRRCVPYPDRRAW
jgi:hypothetical protein